MAIKFTNTPSTQVTRDKVQLAAISFLLITSRSALAFNLSLNIWETVIFMRLVWDIAKYNRYEWQKIPWSYYVNYWIAEIPNIDRDIDLFF